MKSFNYTCVVLFSFVLFPLNFQNGQAEVEEYRPGSKGEVKKVLIQLPHQLRPTEEFVELIDDKIVYQGDILIDKEYSFGWVEEIKTIINAKSISWEDITLTSSEKSAKGLKDFKIGVFVKNWLLDININDLSPLELLNMEIPKELNKLIQEEFPADYKPHGAIAINDKGYNRWPKGVIPYTIDPRFSDAQKKEILAAIKHVGEKTNLRLVNRNYEKNYVKFVPGDGCYSYVGMIGRPQEITLGRCGFGATVHEICHAAGFFHEQSRSDRDTYINIHWENIVEDKKYAFFKHDRDAFDIGPYNHNSIMHYNSGAFSKNGRKTITSKKGIRFGQRLGLMQGDIDAINMVYPKQITRNRMTDSRIIASVNRRDGKSYFFYQNHNYLRFNNQAIRPDYGYPKSVSNNWPNLNWVGIDGATTWLDDKIYMFKGNEYLRYDLNKLEVDGSYPRYIHDAWNISWTNIDAVVARSDRKVYFFKGDEYLRYDLDGDKIDYGYPKKIKMGWDGLPWSNVDAVLNWNNIKYYFFKNEYYIRYDISKGKIDSGYPKLIKGNWPGLT